MSELTDRQRQILRAIVLEYVVGAEPVPSELIASKYGLGVRSATIRNEVKEITEIGFLSQPHKSAGRVPSDLGYRFFVDNLTSSVDPRSSDRQSIRNAIDEDEPLRELLKSTTKTLSRLTHLLCTAALVRNGDVKVRQVLISGLGPGRALLVMVLENGLAENRFLGIPATATIEHIGDANQILADHITGKNLRTLLVHEMPTVPNPLVSQVVTGVWQAIRELAEELTRLQVVSDGEEFILAQPEFQRDSDAMAMVLQALEQGTDLHQAVADTKQGHVTIGSEHESAPLQSLSILREVFFVGTDEAGTLAIVGPTRLDYERNRMLLRLAAEQLSMAVTNALRA